MNQASESFLAAVRQNRPAALVTVMAGELIGAKLLVWPSGESVGSLGDAQIDEQARQRALILLAEQRCERVTLASADHSKDLFIDVNAPPPRLIVIGAAHAAIALISFASMLGYRTVVIDPRRAFATAERIGHADQLLVQWPVDALPALAIDESTCLVTLTHDEKIDTPALAIAARSPACYIGALGSRRTHAHRCEILRAEYGLSEDQLARIHAPIGLDLGGRTPEEIALAIMAEIVAVRHGRRES
jgi:xanthine dehydrogenase accessory factor